MDDTEYLTALYKRRRRRERELRSSELTGCVLIVHQLYDEGEEELVLQHVGFVEKVDKLFS